MNTLITYILSLSILATAITSLPAQPWNFVFLHCESTDGRLYSNNLVPTPNIDKLKQNGVLFASTYANVPVCCPSRSSMLSGKYPHKLPHYHNGILVQGVWNNYEGLDQNFSGTMQSILQANGYDIQIEGKTDWTTGSHSESCMLEALTHNVEFPYNVSLDFGWAQESMCSSNTTVINGGTGGAKGSAHSDDWNALAKNIQYIKNYTKQIINDQLMGKASKPFWIYQGFNILHPDYVTNEYWYDKIDPNNVTVPQWPAINEMHPCDLQASMLKGCLPSDADASWFNDPARITKVRRVYYAELAEYDAMVGAYMQAIEEANLTSNTIFVLDSDHGEMQMEHRQFYKMVQYEGSSHVPLLISNPSITAQTVTQPTQLLDLFPTFLELAGIPIPSDADGYSLVPFLNGASNDPNRPDYILSQFHGDDIAMSWYMIRQGNYKYINFGLGNHSDVGVIPQLFDLSTDPNELNNLWTPTNVIGIQMEKTLLEAIDYPTVSMNVAQYQKDMFTWWINSTPNWKEQIQDPSIVRWATAWAANPTESMQAVLDWLNKPTYILPCRNTTVYPNNS